MELSLSAVSTTAAVPSCSTAIRRSARAHIPALKRAWITDESTNVASLKSSIRWLPPRIAPSASVRIVAAWPCRIRRRGHEAACPVIALLDASDPAYVDEAAKRGVFAYVVLPGQPGELQNALDITLRRFAEFHNLQGAFGRRAIIEQAKGILMARNGIDADSAYDLLKSQSQQSGRRLSDVAEALTQSHQLLSGSTPDPSGQGP